MCTPNPADITADATGALLDRVLSLFDCRPSQPEGEEPEEDSDDEARDQKRRIGKGSRTGRAAGDRNCHRGARCRALAPEDRQALRAEDRARPRRGPAGIQPMLHGDGPKAGRPEARPSREPAGIRPMLHGDGPKASSSSSGRSPPAQAPGVGVPFVQSARELHDSLKEFRVLLDSKGEDADPALKEQLRGVSDQLAAMFLDSGLKAPPPSSSCSADGDGPAGTVKLHVDASMLRGSVGTFRDAQVDFEERQVVVRAVDCNGRTWTLRSAQLPGPIVTDESRFMLGKTGKDLSITLKKANADDVWHQDQIKLSEEALWHSKGSRVSAGSQQAAQGAPSVRGSKASVARGKASSDPGTSSGRPRKKEPDYMKLGAAFI